MLHSLYCKCLMNYTCGHKNKYTIYNYILKLSRNTFSSVYHLEHWRGVNSDSSHEVFKKNKELWNKILNATFRNVRDFLKERADIVRELRSKSDRHVIKSYRPVRPRQHWQVDTIHLNRDEIKQDNNGYDFVLVIIDIFSKYVYLKKLKTKNSKTKPQMAEQVAEHLEHIFHTGDVPEIIQSDNGAEFKGAVIDILKKFGVQQRFTPSYSPQTNGFVENKNK